MFPFIFIPIFFFKSSFSHFQAFIGVAFSGIHIRSTGVSITKYFHVEDDDKTGRLWFTVPALFALALQIIDILFVSVYFEGRYYLRLVIFTCTHL